MSTCPLCDAAMVSKRYYDDEHCWIADCSICTVPMVVWRVHDPHPPTEMRATLRAKLAHVADEAFGQGEWHFDDHMRNIPDHYHAHARRRHVGARRA